MLFLNNVRQADIWVKFSLNNFKILYFISVVAVWSLYENVLLFFLIGKMENWRAVEKNKPNSSCEQLFHIDVLKQERFLLFIYERWVQIISLCIDFLYRGRKCGQLKQSTEMGNQQARLLFSSRSSEFALLETHLITKIPVFFVSFFVSFNWCVCACVCVCFNGQDQTYK